jgi:hypothetical protein
VLLAAAATGQQQLADASATASAASVRLLLRVVGRQAAWTAKEAHCIALLVPIPPVCIQLLLQPLHASGGGRAPGQAAVQA